MIDDLVGMLSRESGMGRRDVERVLLTAPRRYKHFTIPKRSGGERQIAQPAREVKVLQRAFLTHVLEQLPVHSSATAYRKGYSLRDNAEPHVHHGPILKLDLMNFFPSIHGEDWRSYAASKSIFKNHSDLELSVRLLFLKHKGSAQYILSIGAPTSPALSNLLMFYFDTAIFNAVSDDFVVYTRYADDMTFSAPRIGYLNDVRSVVRRTLADMVHPRLHLNEMKTKLVTPKYHRDVTGLTLAQDGRVTVGSLRKRNIRAGLHSASRGLLSTVELEKLAGQIAFCQGIEPDFIRILVRQHGEIVPFVLTYPKKKPF